MSNSNVVHLPSTGQVPATQQLAPTEAWALKRTEVKVMRLVQAFAERRASLHARINKLDHEIEEVLQRYTITHRAHRGKGCAEFHPKISGKLYWWAVLLMFGLEIPLSASAFDMWGLNDDAKWGVALATALALALGASMLGKALRHFSREKLDWIGVGLAVAFTGITGFALWAFADMRQQFITYQNPGLPLSSGMIWQVWAVQLLLFIAVLYVSFSAHSPDPELERILTDKKSLRTRLNALWEQRCGLAIAHDKALATTEHEITLLHQEALQLMMAYRDANLWRRPGAGPSFMRQMPDARVFRPLDLGRPLDAAPATIQELIAQAEEA